MLRLVLGVLAGFLVGVLGILGSESVMLRSLSSGGGGVTVLPEAQIIALQLTISTLWGLAGGWVSARIATGREWAAGGGLGALRLLAFAASAPALREKQPEWYLVTLLVIGIATALLAAGLTAKRQQRLARTAARDESMSAA